MSLHSNKFLFVVIFIGIYAFVSCKKEDAPRPLQSGTYFYSKVGDIGSVRMFTKLGEVKDQNLINTYKVKYAKQLNADSLGGSSSDSLLVMDESNVKIGNKLYAVTKIDNYYQFRSIDTVRYAGQMSQVTYNIMKYKPYYSNTPFVTSSGFSNLITTFYYNYVAVTADGLALPMINYVDVYSNGPNGSYSYTAIGGLNNVFDDKFPVDILKYDTLIVQTYNLHVKR